MPQVVIDGWREGLQKIGMTHLLCERGGLTLKNAKSRADTDAVLEGQKATVSVANQARAEQLAECLQALGANASIV